MTINLEIVVFGIFLLLLAVGWWKVSFFFSTHTLEDDDTTPKAQEKLKQLIIKNIKHADMPLTTRELLKAIQNDEAFDEKLFWRLNENKLEKALKRFYLHHEGVNSIEDIKKLVSI